MCGIGESLAIRTSINSDLELSKDIKFKGSLTKSKTPFPFISITNDKIDKQELKFLKRSVNLSRNKESHPLRTAKNSISRQSIESIICKIFRKRFTKFDIQNRISGLISRQEVKNSNNASFIFGSQNNKNENLEDIIQQYKTMDSREMTATNTQNIGKILQKVKKHIARQRINRSKNLFITSDKSDHSEFYQESDNNVHSIQNNSIDLLNDLVNNQVISSIIVRRIPNLNKSNLSSNKIKCINVQTKTETENESLNKSSKQVSTSDLLCTPIDHTQNCKGSNENNQQRTEINHSAAKGINIIRKYFKASKRDKN